MEAVTAPSVFDLALHGPREITGVIEILDRRRQVTERIKVTNTTPLTLGRDYRNDAVLDDPYVCPSHLKIRLDSDKRLVVEDLGSVNGLFCNGDKRPVPGAVLSSGQTFRVGHTLLRYRHRSFPLAKTRLDKSTRGTVWLFRNPWFNTLAVLLTACYFMLEAFLDTTLRFDLFRLARDVLPYAFFVLAWAIIWSLVNRLTLDHLAFFSHTAIVATGLLSGALFYLVDDHILFALAIDSQLVFLWVVGSALIGTTMLYAHLRFCSKATPLTLAGVASTIMLFLIGVGAIYYEVEKSKFSTDPSFNVLLKPPAFQLVDGESPEGFFARTHTLKEKLERAASR